MRRTRYARYARPTARYTLIAVETLLAAALAVAIAMALPGPSAWDLLPF